MFFFSCRISHIIHFISICDLFTDSSSYILEISILEITVRIFFCVCVFCVTNYCRNLIVNEKSWVTILILRLGVAPFYSIVTTNCEMSHSSCKI
jgi:hypothetical protein